MVFLAGHWVIKRHKKTQRPRRNLGSFSNLSITQRPRPSREGLIEALALAGLLAHGTTAWRCLPTRALSGQ